MNKQTKNRRFSGAVGRNTVWRMAILSAFATLSATTHAVTFGSEESGITGSFDSTISFGVTQRSSDANCMIVGNDNGGCNRGSNNTLNTYYGGGTRGYANADVNYLNGDDGNLNYKRGNIASQVIKGTHELALKMDGGWSSLARFTWQNDSRVTQTQRTDLTGEGKDAATSRVDMLDMWIAKSFDLGGSPAKVKLGNQVVSWGEDIFILGGINQVNAIDLGHFHTPGTQLKEVFIPAPMVSFSAGLSQKINLEGYYQVGWNAFKLDPVGTYFSTVDLVGKGNRPLYMPTAVATDFGLGAGAGEPTTPGYTGAFDTPYAGENKPKDNGQYGLALRMAAPEIDSEFALYYQRYHDKLPFLGFSGNSSLQVTGYSLNYGQDKDLFGASMNTKVGPVAIGAEISYRPRDSVQIDPTVPFGAAGGGAFNPFSVYDVGFHPGFVEEKKWQSHVTAFYTFSRNDPLGSIAQALGASDGVLLGEAAVAYYPDLDETGSTPYLLPNYDLPTRMSWGYVLEASLNYPNAFDSGFTITPQIDYAHDVRGTSPNTIPFVEGRKAITYSLFFNRRDTWKAGVQYVRFFGGGDNNVMLDHDFLSASISRSF
jgi:Protein of unknown function (DUF1302)